MAQFVRAKYETNSGEIYRTRVETTTITAANPQPSGNYSDSRVYVYVGESNRKAGISARGVRLRRALGTVAGRTVYAFSFRPVLTQAAFAALNLDQTLTFDGVEWTVNGFKPEG